MTKVEKLTRLERLRTVADQLMHLKVLKPEDENTRKELHEELCTSYGEVADLFAQSVGHRTVNVPIYGDLNTTYSNYFEVGFLSSRTIHRYEGYNELLKVIGIVNRQSSEESVDAPRGSKVFIVHGRDDSAKEKCARFLGKLQLQVVILHEQPNKGRTIIEKFEEAADVGFAVVILTPDDLGGIATEPTDSYKPRARQNVIFELGFFLGQLGRNRVCALCGDQVEIPSDYNGVLYLPMDEGGGWQLKLAGELRAAGLPVDLNTLIV